MTPKDLEQRSIADLTPYARNSRTHSEAQVAQIAASITEFGFTNPVLVDAEGGIIAGHGRVLAAQSLGLETVPVLVLDHLTEDQRRAYVIADNKLGLNAGWDEDALRAEIEALTAAGYDLDVIGFDEAELSSIRSERTKGITDPDDVPAAPSVPTSAVGDLWLLGRHRLLVGDATSEANLDQLMAGSAADLVWTDPPYNVAISGTAGTIMNDDMADGAFRSFLDAAFANYARALKLGGVIYVAHADSERVNFTASFTGAGLKLSQVRIWVKHSATLSRQDFNWQHEPILYGWREGAGHYFAGDFTKTTVLDQDLDVDKLKRTEAIALLKEVRQHIRSTVIRHDRPTKSDLHPTMKPVALVQEMIEDSSRHGEIVLDLFGGSGSTLIAAEKVGRRARLMELDPRFADVIVRRREDFAGRVATLEATGQSFREVADERRALAA